MQPMFSHTGISLQFLSLEKCPLPEDLYDLPKQLEGYGLLKNQTF